MWNRKRKVSRLLSFSSSFLSCLPLEIFDLFNSSIPKRLVPLERLYVWPLMSDRLMLNELNSFVRSFLFNINFLLYVLLYQILLSSITKVWAKMIPGGLVVHDLNSNNRPSWTKVYTVNWLFQKSNSTTFFNRSSVSKNSNTNSCSTPYKYVLFSLLVSCNIPSSFPTDRPV